MEAVTKKNGCAFTVYLGGPGNEKESSVRSMQEAFETFRRRRQEELQSFAGRKVPLQRRLQQPEAQWQLRMKFLKQAKSYIGVPYTKKYHQPGTPESKSLLFLDCCGLIRRVARDLTEDFGFYIGSGNQAYQYDTLPITLPSEEHLKPGDLIFISGTYFDTQRARQPHNIVHVEIWLGEEKRSLGARWKEGRVQVFDSFKFVSKTYGSMEYHFKSIETWLQGICISHCPEHKWASARQVPGRKSIFSPLTEPGEPAEEDADAQRNASEPQPESEKLALTVQSVIEYVSNCGLSTSKQVEALDLQGFSRAGSGLARMNHLSRDQVTEAGQGQHQSPPRGTFLETGGLNMEGASFKGTVAQEREPEEGPLERQLVARCQEANLGVIPPSRPISDSVNKARKSFSTPKVNSKGALGGAKRNKKGKARTQKGNLHLGGPPSGDAGVSNLTKGESMSKANLKPSPRMNPPEERKPEEPSGPGLFFYIGGANGYDIVNVYCENKGWQRIYDNRRVDYILKWCETKHREDYCNFREGQQLLYQIPNNRVLTTKIGLLVNLREYERVMTKIPKNGKFLKMEDFFPETFRLDMKDERDVFFEIYKEPHIWICKPTSSNQGRGIFLLKNQEQVRRFQFELQNVVDNPAYKKAPHRSPGARILQRYIDRPLLIEGRKFDVRSYLLIACTVPYLLFFGHGYVRLTCLSYNPMSDDITSHLTNQCVQKKNPIYHDVKEDTVWQMDRFNAYVNERFRHSKGLPKDWVMNYFTRRMKEIMLHCFLAVKSKLDCKLGYFDLIGCDFLIDEEFKVWLLEMNSNPALHTNCGTLKSVIPMVVKETLDLVIEIFTKSQKAQPILPLESLRHFVLIYNGVASDNRLPRPTKSRTSLHSLHGPREGNTNAPSAANSSNSSGTSVNRAVDKPPPKPLEKLPRMEPPGPPEATLLLPYKAVTRDILPMTQIQISMVPNLSSCPSVKAVLRGKEVCSHGNPCIIKNVPESDRHHTGPCKANSSDNKSRNNPTGAVASISKDRSYGAWLQQTFATKYSSSGGNLAGLPLSSSQMISLHLQSNFSPNIPVIQDHAGLPYQPMAQAKPSTHNRKAEAGSSSCNNSLPEDTKASHRGS